MDTTIDNVCVIHENHFKAIDDAVWKNFSVRKLNCAPFYAIEHKCCAVVSDNILELFDLAVIHPLFEDYLNMDYDHISLIAQDDNPLTHWEEIKGMFSSLDGEILRFILAKKIPLEKFIRHELASRGHDENHQWCGIDKAKEIWLT